MKINCLFRRVLKATHVRKRADVFKFRLCPAAAFAKDVYFKKTAFCSVNTASCAAVPAAAVWQRVFPRLLHSLPSC